MDQKFIDVLNELVKEQGREALIDGKKCKAFIGDYTRNEFQVESRQIQMAVEAGVSKALEETDGIALCIKQQIERMKDEFDMSHETAENIVNYLAHVLRGISTPREKAEAKKLSSKAFRMYEEERPLEEINAVLDEAIRLNPYYAEAYHNRGQNYEIEGKLDEALNYYNQALKCVPIDDSMSVQQVYFDRADVYKKMGKLDLALEDINSSLKLGFSSDSTASGAYYIRGAIYLEQGKIDLAKQDFEASLKKDGHNPDPEIALIKLMPDKLTDEDSKTIWELYKSAEQHFDKEEDFEKALEKLNEAIKIYPQFWQAYLFRAEIYIAYGDDINKEYEGGYGYTYYEYAANNATIAKALNKDNASSYSVSAEAQLKLRYYDAAIEDAGKYIELEPANAAAWYLRGKINKQKKDYKSAVRDLEKAVELDPNSKRYKKMLEGTLQKMEK